MTITYKTSFTDLSCILSPEIELEKKGLKLLCINSNTRALLSR